MSYKEHDLEIIFYFPKLEILMDQQILKGIIHLR